MLSTGGDQRLVESLQLIWREERARLQGCTPPPPPPEPPRTPFDVCLLVTAARQDFQNTLALHAQQRAQKAADNIAADVATIHNVPEGGDAEDEGTQRESSLQHDMRDMDASQSPLLPTLEPAALLAASPTALPLPALAPLGSPNAPPSQAGFTPSHLNVASGALSESLNCFRIL